MHTGAQGLGPREAPEEHLSVKGLKVGQGLGHPLPRNPPGHRESARPRGGTESDSDQEEPCWDAGERNWCRANCYDVGTGARAGLSGASPEAVGTEGRGGIPEGVCEDGTWAPREEAAARMTWAPDVPRGRSAHQQLQQARHGLPV